MLHHLELLERVIGVVEGGGRVAVCVVVGTRGSAPQEPGAMLVVDQGMSTSGTLGGGCVEAEVRTRALDLLAKGESSLLSFNLDQDPGWDDGLICGGHMDVAVMSVPDVGSLDPFRRAVDDMRAFRPASVVLPVEQEGRPIEYRLNIEQEPTLLIAGAGHVGTELAKLATRLEFRVVVVDDRSDFADSDRLPPPIEPVVGDIGRTLCDFPIDPATYVVIVTRGHKHDQAALHAVVESSAQYIGMIGSGRKIRAVFDALADAGVSRDHLARVHSPVGLDINAVTVPEIAVSIAAELVSVRRQQRRKPVEGPIQVGAEKRR